jgi:hypothetical protein
MKLKNKKSGEVINNNGISFTEGNYKTYSSLAELNAEWEDYEEPKECWYIGNSGEVYGFSNYFIGTEIEEAHREIGNLFDTREEAEKAAEKLKAWKRLKDKGFRFTKWTIPEEPKTPHINLVIEAEMDVPDSPYEIDLLFRGEE